MTRLRILSLLASATEIICALGYRDNLVGRSHECDYPASVLTLPQTTTPKIAIHTSSAAIDAAVKNKLQYARAEEALGIYDIDRKKIQELQPTHIVTQMQCEVCAVSLRDVEFALARIVEPRPTILSLQPNSLEDIWADVHYIAENLGNHSTGERLVSQLQCQMAHIAKTASSLPTRRSVVVIEWVDPLMTAGNWMPELIAMAGGHCLLSRAGAHSNVITFDSIVAADPDVLLLCPCGFDLARTLQDIPILQTYPDWTSLQAVRKGRVFAADGNQFFNRPGPRLVESLEILSEILYPEWFDFGHAQDTWKFQRIE